MPCTDHLPHSLARADIIALALADLLADVERAIPQELTDNPSMHRLRQELISGAIEGAQLLFAGSWPEPDPDEPAVIIVADFGDQAHTIEAGRCDCGTRCAGRAAVQLQQRITKIRSRFVCHSCARGQFTPDRLPSGEECYICNQCGISTIAGAIDDPWWEFHQEATAGRTDAERAA